MRIALIGQAAFGTAVLEAIAKTGKDEIVGVFSPPDREGRPQDPIVEVANASTDLAMEVRQELCDLGIRCCDDDPGVLREQLVGRSPAKSWRVGGQDASFGGSCGCLGRGRMRIPACAKSNRHVT